MSLTGKTRHRVKKKSFGGYHLVLQMEENVTHEEGCRDEHTFQRWRDATVEDLAELSNWKFNVVNGG